MLYNFSTRFDEKMEAEMQLLGRSKNDIIIIASIIEKETDGSDQKNIASVLYNRLNNTWATPRGYLQVDSTIQYLLEERKETLTQADLEIDSPYNTYLYPGLPVGAICNPAWMPLRRHWLPVRPTTITLCWERMDTPTSLRASILSRPICGAGGCAGRRLDGR